jgi:bifunctional non-homologous end joining protein LigD
MRAKGRGPRGSLAEYRRKRDFRVTSEPAGDRASKRGAGGAFVVQKHDATRLHYDLRLEMDGVMRSWAVPKGPSLDPGQKRLAMETEDHPMAYNKFEGVIPKGEYGAGPVIVWDRGRWAPEGDPLAAYAKGHIAFEVEGEKMRGGWDLVRMHGRPGESGRAWLLVKRKDAEARTGAEADLPTRRPESVVSGRRVEELGPPRADPKNERRQAPRGGNGAVRPASRRPRAAKAQAARPRPWSPPRAAPPGALPREPAAQLCTLVDAAPDGGEWLHEVKIDGYRILARKSGDHVTLLSRNAKDWTARFRAVADAVRSLPVRDLLLDGEVAVIGADGKTSFQGLQGVLGGESSAALAYVVFDLLHAAGRDVSRLALIERKGALSTLIPPGDPVLRYSDHALGEGPAYHRAACRLGLEGIVSKRSDRPYVAARTRDWLKVRCGKRQEFVLVGYQDHSADARAIGALLLGVRDETGRLVYAGKVGTGFDTALRRDLKRRLDDLRVEASPVTGVPRAETGAHWAEPRLVGEVSFTEWTADGRLRHPSFEGLREDKPARDVRRERPDHVEGDEIEARPSGPRARRTVAEARPRRTPGPAPKTKPGRRSTAGAPRAEESPDVVAGVRITHPARVLWAEQGITKRDLARYYADVAEWVLPHVVGRPIALVRCPAGPSGECFYQKHPLPGSPVGLASVRVDPGPHGLVSPVVTGIEGVVWLVQMGTVELHAWGSRADDLEHPDRLVMDLDPAPDVRFARVVAGARELRERLRLLGLASFVKTTGGKGLHVVVPLTGRHGWDDVKSFAHALADGMAADAPELYLSQAAKAKRSGRIYVDWLRNGRGATAVAAYSTRAKPGAPISAPLAWDELGPRSKPDQWRIGNLPHRLRSLGKDPWAGFGAVKQTLDRALKAMGRG